MDDPSDKKHAAYIKDIFVRASTHPAIKDIPIAELSFEHWCLPSTRKKEQLHTL